MKRSAFYTITFITVWGLAAFACRGQDTYQIPSIDLSIVNVDDLIWDLEFLEREPEFDYMDSTSKVREILFDGPDHSGEPTKVFAYYSNPDILKTGTNQGNKFPGVVLISGGSQPAIREWVERWAHEGYAAITCDYGNTRLSDQCGPAPGSLEQRLAYIYDSIAHGPKAVRAYRTTAIAILAHSLLLSFPEVEKTKTAVTGISWGGFQTCIVSGIDSRFKAAAPVYGCAFHDEIIFKKHFSGMTAKEKALWMDKIDPKNYIIFSQCPTLFINGNKDGCFDIGAFDKTTKLIPEKNRSFRITPDMGHDHPSGWKPREIAAFFNSKFKDGIPLAKITKFERGDSILRFDYMSNLSIKKADFYYSNDTISINEQRKWESLPAKIFDNRIESGYPKDGFAMGFLYLTDIMDLGVSSELITN